MRKGPANPYSDIYLDELMNRVLYAYARNREKGVANLYTPHLDVSKPPNSVHNHFYSYFVNDIKRSTNKDISNGTVFKLLGRSHSQKSLVNSRNKFEDISIDAFEEYAVIIQQNDGTKTRSFDCYKVSGVKVIDAKFCEAISNTEPAPKTEDFYLAKEEKNCQWHGIIRNWYCEREKDQELKDHIKRCFELPNPIAAVVTGSGGTGKSASLRKLAVTSISFNYNVLWVTSVSRFFNDLFKIENIDNERFLLIFEDWTQVTNTDFARLLLGEVVKLSNVRIVIGDRYLSNEYSSYVRPENHFPLKSRDNESIIKWVLKVHDDWETVANKLLTLEIYKQPLFVILFILSRNNENIKEFVTDQLFYKIQDIVNYDFKKIYRRYPTLVRVIYYWMCMLQGRPTIQMSWKNLLSWADCYAPVPNTSAELVNFNEDKETCKILSNYISLQPYTYLKEEDSQLFFHHDILKEALRVKINQDWNFDTNVKLEILKYLLSNGQVELARDIWNFVRRNTELTKNQKEYFWSFFRFKFPSLKMKIRMSDKLQKINFYAEQAQTEAQWEDILVYLTSSFFIDGINAYPYLISHFLENGCTAVCMKEAYGHSLTKFGCYRLSIKWNEIGDDEKRSKSWFDF